MDAKPTDRALSYVNDAEGIASAIQSGTYYHKLALVQINCTMAVIEELAELRRMTGTQIIQTEAYG